MRRKDREITDSSKILEILEACDCVRLALRDAQGLYIVPMNFGYRFEESGRLTLFMHSAREGRKIAAFRENPTVAFEMDCAHRVLLGTHVEIPCEWGFGFQSLIGTGNIRFLTDSDEKTEALKALMRHYTDQEFEFRPQMWERIEVLALEVTEFSAKMH